MLNELPEGTVIRLRPPYIPSGIPGDALLLVKMAEQAQVVYNPWPRFMAVGYGRIIAVGRDTPYEHLGRIWCEPENAECMAKLMADLQPVAREQLQDFLTRRSG